MQFFFAYRFSQILKKHTYESENFWRNFFAHRFSQILKKSIPTKLTRPQTDT